MARNETEVFAGKYFRLTVDEDHFERVYQRNGITVIAITDDKKIRFIHKTTRENKTPRIALVTGYVKDGEDPRACAERELEEEIGSAAETWFSFCVVASGGGIEKLQHIFIAQGLRPIPGAVQSDPNEQILGTVDFTCKEVLAQILAGDFDGIGPDNCFALMKFVIFATSRSSDYPIAPVNAS